APQAGGVAQDQRGDVGSRVRDADTGDLLVGKASYAGDVAETAAACDLRIEHQLGRLAAALPEPDIEEDGARERGGRRLFGQQTVRAEIRRTKGAVLLRDHRDLGVGAVPRRLRLLLLFLLLA